MKPDHIEANKERIESLLRSTGREGMEEVIKYLNEHDFYRIPSSLHRHHNWEGGLAQHCLGVYDRLAQTGEKLPGESVIIAALLHDICKARKIYRDPEGKWRERPEHQLHIKGHGERSVKLLEKTCGLQLTPDEKNAIRWHMGGYNLPKEELRNFFSNKNNELWRLLYNADRYDASKGKMREEQKETEL